MARRPGDYGRLDRRRRLLRVEHLEDRRMLAVATVTTHLDVVDFGDGVTSLREAIFATNTVSGADTIEFAASLDGATINLNLSLGEIDITDSLTVDASSLAGGLTIDAGDGLDGIFATGDGIRIFNIDSAGSDLDVELVGLTLTGGDLGVGVGNVGGAIRSLENLTITSSTISGNAAGSFGGGIYADGDSESTRLVVRNSTISGNKGSSGGGVHAHVRFELTDSFVIANQVTSSGGRGGGIRGNSYLSMVNSTIADNRTDGPNSRGGGVYFGGDLVAVGSTISGNVSRGRGGGLYLEPYNEVSPTFTDCTIQNNYGRSSGGGMEVLGAVSLTDCLVSGNSTTGEGGGIKGDAVLLRSTISGNSAGQGGGIRGDAVVMRSTVSGNQGGEYGGGIDGYSVTVTDSTVSGNSAQVYGGGIKAQNVTVTNSTISGNSALRGGGGIYSRFGDVTVRHSTITGNHVSNQIGEGGGIRHTGESTSVLEITSSIVAGNSGDFAADITHGAGVLQVDFSLIGDTEGSGITASTGAGNLLNVAPMLGPLADNGGPKLTHMPLVGSPVVNAGNVVTDAALSYDQRGPVYSRVYGGRVDMGAVEVQPLRADFDNDGDVDGLDFLAWQIGVGAAPPSALQGDGDADGDGDVDDVDLAAWEESYGTVQPFTDISIEFVGGDEEVTNGDPVVFTFVVTNHGTEDVTGIGVLSEMSSMLANVSWTAAITGSGAANVSGIGSIDELVDLTAQSSIAYSITADVAIPNADEPAQKLISSFANVSIPVGIADYVAANNRAHNVDLVQAEVTGGAAQFVASSEVIGNSPAWGHALGDVDGDGDLDAIVLYTGAAIIRKNNGSGVFATNSTINFFFDTALAAALGDLDDDGDLDIVFFGSAGAVWRNNGSGVFTLHEDRPEWGSYPGPFLLTDVDGDGDLDVVTETLFKDPTEIWLNDGSGHFAGTGQHVPGLLPEVGDVDGDGDADLLVSDVFSGGGTHLWLNDGTGVFGHARLVVPGTNRSTDLGDLDGDGDLDLVIAQSSAGYHGVWLNDGTGEFVDSGQRLSAFFISTGEHQLALGDLDGDGDLDFISPFTLKAIWQNDGTGQFTVIASGITGPDTRTWVALGDLDRDGDLDAYRVRWQSTGGDIVHFNQAPLPLVAPQFSAFTGLDLSAQTEEQGDVAPVYEEPAAESPQAIAFAELGATSLSPRVADFGDIAVSRPREDDSSTAKHSLDEELILSSL